MANMNALSMPPNSHSPGNRLGLGSVSLATPAHLRQLLGEAVHLLTESQDASLGRAS